MSMCQQVIQSNNETQAKWESIIPQILANTHTPVFLIDLDQVEAQYTKTLAAFRQIQDQTGVSTKIFYAIKSNPDLRVLSKLQQLGCGFEINTEGELTLIKSLVEDYSLPLDSSDIINSAPIKDARDIQAMHDWGINSFAFDTPQELEKIHRVCGPGTNVYVRLKTPNTNSSFELNRKFGIENDQAHQLLCMAQDMGLTAIGVTFHVGSQCNNLGNWKSALKQCQEVFALCMKSGVHCRMINLGGGFPHNYHDIGLSLEVISNTISQEIRTLFEGFEIELWAEPGRLISSACGTILTRVIGIREENQELYVDASVFNLFMERLQLGSKNKEILYPYWIYGKSGGETLLYSVFGNSCDGTDLLFSDIPMAKVELDDIIVFHSTGSYSLAYQSRFNGICPPTIIYMEKGVIDEIVVQ